MFTCSNSYWEVYRRFQRDLFWFRGSVEEGYEGGYIHGGNSMKTIHKRISMKGAQDFLALFEKTLKE